MIVEVASGKAEASEGVMMRNFLCKAGNIFLQNWKGPGLVITTLSWKERLSRAGLLEPVNGLGVECEKKRRNERGKGKKKTRKRSNRRRVNGNAWQSVVVGARNGFVDMYSVASRASAQQRTAILLQAPRCCHRALAAHCSARRLQRSAQNRAGGRSLARGGRQAGRASCGWWTAAGG